MSIRIHPRVTRTGILAGAALAGLTMTAATVASASSSPAAPVSDHADVIAQGLVTFGAGEHHWNFGGREVAAAGATFGVDAPTFLYSDGGAALVSTDGDARWRVADNEASFVPAAASLAASAADGGSTWLSDIRIELGAGDRSFTPGAGTRDVDLVHDMLAAGETLQMSAEVSALVIVIQGDVTDAAGATITSTETVVQSGDLALTNTGSTRAEVLVAVVGPLVDAAAAPQDGDTSEPSGPSNGTPTTSPAPTTMAPTTTVDDSDADGDSLTASQEAALGTDPQNNDTDGDGFWDGHEVNVTGTNPLMADSDGDGLNDYLEAHDLLIDANDPDSDDDGLTDGQEFQVYATDPEWADSDNDGFTDKAEVDAGTNPNNGNDHP